AGMMTVGIVTASADDQLLWQQMYPEQLVRFKEFAHLVISADADHQDAVLKIWGQRQLPLIEYGIGFGENEGNSAMGSLIWIVDQFKAGEGGQLNGNSAIDFDYRWQPVKSAPPIDAAIPSIDVYVSNDALPDLARVAVQHEEGLAREVVHRGYGCQMARWSRNGEIVKAVGTDRVGADQGVPIDSSTEGLTTKGLDALCASRIVMFGLGLNFNDTEFSGPMETSVMLEGAQRPVAMPSPGMDQPLIELLYRSNLKPGMPMATALAFIDGLKVAR
ncbi:MAG TPA: hypothetical protein VN229_14860, partial [Terriglobales bacterium]|nr:hypothetical protein [Terriglobales bacterium]